MSRYLFLILVVACSRGEPAVDESARRADAAADSTFAAVQSRGAVAMGVDQYTSTHHFTPTADGGIIELQRDTLDSAGVAQIRDHMRQIAGARATARTKETVDLARSFSSLSSMSSTGMRSSNR